MMIFISGASRSGKSEQAEKICVKLAGANKKIYLATAQVYDDEMRRRVERHKLMRKDKKFFTLEKTHNLHEILNSNMIGNNDTVLLECLPNWAANEMFIPDGIENANKNINNIKLKIFKTILDLNLKCANLIIVSDDIFSDGIIYDDITESYIKLLAELHILIAAKADKAIECTSGLVYYFKI